MGSTVLMIAFHVNYSSHMPTHTHTLLNSNVLIQTHPLTPPPSTTPSESKPDLIRVVATILHPEIFYKTLPITPTTSAYDVIAALVEKYAIAMEDQNPDVFYLMEVSCRARDSEVLNLCSGSGGTV